jgi:hypothetical protein
MVALAVDAGDFRAFGCKTTKAPAPLRKMFGIGNELRGIRRYLTNNGKSTLQLPIKTSLYDANDALVLVYGYDTANNANTDCAQTALIQITNFAASLANSLAASIQIPVGQPDPASSTALSISGGQVFASNNYLYVALANNITRRVALSSF